MGPASTVVSAGTANILLGIAVLAFARSRRSLRAAAALAVTAFVTAHVAAHVAAGAPALLGAASGPVTAGLLLLGRALLALRTRRAEWRRAQRRDGARR